MSLSRCRGKGRSRRMNARVYIALGVSRINEATHLLLDTGTELAPRATSLDVGDRSWGWMDPAVHRSTHESE